MPKQKQILKTKKKNIDTVKEKVEVVQETRSQEVRRLILQAKSNISIGYIDTALLLNEAYKEGFYKDWGFSEFADYAHTELEVKYRKAMYFVEIGQKVEDFNLNKERLEQLGWTRVKELVRVITADNLEDWIDKASNMTTRELVDAVRMELGLNIEKEKKVRVEFILNEDTASIIFDALSEAKKITENENPTLALELICQDWMELKGISPEKTTLESHIKYIKRVYGKDVVLAENEQAQEEILNNNNTESEKVETEEDAESTIDIEEDLNEMFGIDL